MPFPLPPTPWLGHPADPTDEYRKSYALGASTAEANARTQLSAQEAQARINQSAASEQQSIALAQQKLQQQEQQTQMSLAVRQQLAEKKALQEQQKIEISKSYHESQMGLQKQRLDQAKQVADAKAKQTADRSAAIMEYTNNVASIEGRQDMTDDQKYQSKLSLMMRMGPSMSGGISGMSGIVNADRASIPKNLETKQVGDNTFYHSSPYESWKHQPNAHSDLALGNTIASHTMTQISKLEEDLKTEGITKKKRDEVASQLTESKMRVNKIARQRKQEIPFPEVESDSKSSGGKASHRFIYGRGILPIEDDQQQADPTGTGE